MVIPAFSLLRRFDDGVGDSPTYIRPIHPQEWRQTYYLPNTYPSSGGGGSEPRRGGLLWYLYGTYSQVTASASAGDPVNLARFLRPERLFPLGGVVYHLKDKKGSEGFPVAPVPFFGSVVGDGNKKRSPVLCLKEAGEPLWKDG